MPQRNAGLAKVRGFSIIELLVVIAIIAFLIAVLVVAGRAVFSGARERSTRGTLEQLELMLTDYLQQSGGELPAFVQLPNTGAPIEYAPVADAFVEDDASVINTVGLFLIEAEKYESVSTTLAGLNAESVQQRPLLFRPTADPADPLFRTVLDAWGNPIRLVHPQFDGLYTDADAFVKLPPRLARDPGREISTSVDDWSELTRSPASSDGGETSGRPYFYSAGPDGRVGWEDANGNGQYDPGEIDYNRDNVYITRPRLLTPSDA